LNNDNPDQPVDLSKAVLQSLNEAHWRTQHILVDVLRLDLIHPVVSGNKWFKLKYHLQEAIQQGKQGIVTFGGAWSNHLVATAFTCQKAGLSSIGIIRGEQPAQLSLTLQDALQYGMQLQFVSRASYADQQQMEVDMTARYPDHYMVPMGAQSHCGVQGASEILSLMNYESYTHIACAVGTGTMMAGLVKASLPHQQVIGISSLKMTPGTDNSLHRFVAQQTDRQNFQLFFDYHFGGYARKTNELISFMNDLYERHRLPTDFVYTGKLLVGLDHLIMINDIKPNSRILVIHSGGLQGNRSLPEGTLTFL
jgi:1-aminocyclopropane-1-carboxylate deaminase